MSTPNVVGSAFVEVLADTGGFAASLTSGLSRADQAAAGAGTQTGQAFARAVQGAADQVTVSGVGAALGAADGAARAAGAGTGQAYSRALEAGLPDASAVRREVDRGLQGAEAAAKEEGKKAGGLFSSEFRSSIEGKLEVGRAIAGVGAGAGLGFGAAFLEATNVQATNAKLAAQLGVAAADSGRLGKVAGGLYANAYGDSLEGVNAAVKSVVQDIRVSVNSADLSGITAKVLDLSTAFDVDLGGVTRATGQLLKTGLAKDANEALDIVTAGFQKGADKSGDFLDTLNEYGTQFRKLGLDGQTATGLISQGLKAGARDSDIVADALKEFSIRAVDGSETTATSFKGLGLSAKDFAEKIAAGGPVAEQALGTVLERLRAVKDPVKQAALATGLFGTQAEDLGKALFALDPSSAVQGLGQVEGAAGRMGATLNDTAQSKLTAFTRGLQQNLVAFTVNVAIPALVGLATTVSGTVSPVLSSIGTAVGPVAASLVSFGQAIPTPLLQAGAVAVGALVAVIAGAAAVNAIASASTAAFTAVKAIFVATTDAETGAVTASTLARAGGTIATVAGTAATVAGTVAMGAASLATGVLTAATTALNAVLALNPFVLVAVAVAALVVGLVIAYQKSETFRAIVKAAFDGVLAAARAVEGFFTTTLPAAFTTAKDKVASTVSGVVEFIRSNFTVILAVITGPIGLAVLFISRNFDTIKSTVSGAISAVRGAVSSGISTVVSLLTGLPGRAAGALGSLASTLFRIATDALASFGAAERAGLSTAVSVVAGLPGRILGALGSLGGLLVGVGGDIVAGLARGIRAGVGSIGDALLSLIPGPLRRFAGALGINSPSRVYAELGDSIPEGLALGVTRSSNLVAAAVGAIAGDVTRGLTSRDLAAAAERALQTSVDKAAAARDAALAKIPGLQRAAQAADGRDDAADKAATAARARADAALAAQKKAEQERDKDAIARAKTLAAALDKLADQAEAKAKATAAAQKQALEALAAGRKDLAATTITLADEVLAAQKAAAQAAAEAAQKAGQEARDAAVASAKAQLDTYAAEVDELLARSKALTGSFRDAVLSGTSLKDLFSGVTGEAGKAVDDAGKAAAAAAGLVSSAQAKLTEATDRYTAAVDKNRLAVAAANAEEARRAGLLAAATTDRVAAEKALAAAQAVATDGAAASPFELEQLKGAYAALAAAKARENQAGDAAASAADAAQKARNSEVEGLAELRAAQSALAEAQSQAAATAAAYAKAQSAAGDVVGSVVEQLQTKLADAKSFAEGLGTLAGLGLNDTLLAQVAALGPQAGAAIVAGLIAAGPVTIAQINELTTSIGVVASTGLDKVAETLFGPGRNALTSFVGGIRAGFPELDSAIAEIAAKLNQIGLGNAAIAAATSAAPTAGALSVKPGTPALVNRAALAAGTITGTGVQVTQNNTTEVNGSGLSQKELEAALAAANSKNNDEMVRLVTGGMRR